MVGLFVALQLGLVGALLNELFLFLFLHHKEPPVITNPMKQLTLIENETLSLYCNATGRPEPLVLWQKVNATNQVHANPLHIAQVKRNSSGSYECVAVNGAGTAFAITHVDVQCEYLQWNDEQGLYFWTNVRRRWISKKLLGNWSFKASWIFFLVISLDSPTSLPN